MINGHILAVGADAPLRPLRDVKTGEVIPNVPKATDLSTLDGTFPLRPVGITDTNDG